MVHSNIYRVTEKKIKKGYTHAYLEMLTLKYFVVFRDITKKTEVNLRYTFYGK